MLEDLPPPPRRPRRRAAAEAAKTVAASEGCTRVRCCACDGDGYLGENLNAETGWNECTRCRGTGSLWGRRGEPLLNDEELLANFRRKV